MASTTTIALLLFASALLSTTTVVDGDGQEQLWCVAKGGTSDEQLQSNLDYACASIDCRDIKPGGKCFEPNNVQSHASYAMNNFYQSLGKKQSDCDFKGSGQLVQNDPSTASCKFFDGKNYTNTSPSSSSEQGKKWCVPKPETTDKQLQGNLDYACGTGIDCRPIQAGGSCFEPNTVKAHATYAMNSLYQTLGKQDSECDFSGTGQLVTTDPSYGGCKYL